LRLSQCGITDEGASELFIELRNLPNLLVIDLSYNPITEKSLDSLAGLL
jgi:Leucine-rich repeat (LRR) protein